MFWSRSSDQELRTEARLSQSTFVCVPPTFRGRRNLV